ncbi:MAG TPA: M23 family metallopeptidase [Thermodesulfobacteriota bacterium]|nr:M23 family metallopeptidase [Thermodesulfobacteriota bacterium]
MHLRRFTELRKEIKSIRPPQKRVFVFLIFFFAFFPLLVSKHDSYSFPTPQPYNLNEFLSNSFSPFLADIQINSMQGKVESGDTFCSILSDQGFSSLTIAECVEAFKPVFNCRKLSPGDEYTIKTDGKGNFCKLTIKTDLVTIYHLRKEGEKLLPSKDKVYLHKKITKVSGVIEDSLFGAIAKAGEHDQVAIDFAEIFAWDIDFRHDLQKGDQVALIIEKYFKDDQLFCYGKIKAAEYNSQDKVYRAIYFKDPKGQEGYFTPEGISVRKSFIRAPLKFNRISSGYSYSRFHPILKKSRPHLGIDFAAPQGTPVLSVGDGVVVEKGWKNGNGNTVRIRHPLGYETMYNHLWRYAKNIKIGNRVRQKEIIGYVGTTGLSTGPHLDYRMKKNGKFINPLAEKFPPGFPVDNAYRHLFAKTSRKMIAQLEEKEDSFQKMVAAR